MTALYRAAAALFLAVAAAGPAHAGDPPPPATHEGQGDGADASAIEDPVVLCERFAATVERHSDDCPAMGTALEALVDAEWRGLERMASEPIPAELEAACLSRVEAAIAPLVACIGDDTVSRAMQRLKALHNRSRRSEAAPP